MGNAPSQHHASRSASVDTSVTSTPVRRRPEAVQRRSTPASAPVPHTASETHNTPPHTHLTSTSDEKVDHSSVTTSSTPPALPLPLPASHSDEDIVHTLAPKHNPASLQHRHPLLAALDALPQTEPLSNTLDPPSLDHQSTTSPHRIERIQRIDARAVDELLRLCRQYVKDDVTQLLADQRDIARRLDSIDEEFSVLPATLRSMSDDVRLLLLELNTRQLPAHS